MRARQARRTVLQDLLHGRGVCDARVHLPTPRAPVAQGQRLPALSRRDLAILDDALESSVI